MVCIVPFYCSRPDGCCSYKVLYENEFQCQIFFKSVRLVEFCRILFYDLWRPVRFHSYCSNLTKLSRHLNRIKVTIHSLWISRPCHLRMFQDLPLNFTKSSPSSWTLNSADGFFFFCSSSSVSASYPDHHRNTQFKTLERLLVSWWLAAWFQSK